MRHHSASLPPLGPARRPPVATVITGNAYATRDAGVSDPSGPDGWVSKCVQPAAMRWFGEPVTDIKQISAYWCRGMVRAGGSRYFRTRLRQRARHRRFRLV